MTKSFIPVKQNNLNKININFHLVNNLKLYLKSFLTMYFARFVLNDNLIIMTIKNINQYIYNIIFCILTWIVVVYHQLLEQRLM
jgi:hypothetical protein